MSFIPSHYVQFLPHIAIVATGVAVIILLFLALTVLRLRDVKNSAAQYMKLLERKRSDYRTLQEESTEIKIRNARLITLLKNERKSNQEKLAIIDEAKEKLRLQFQTLAQQIFDEKSAKFGSENKERVSALLLPLQQQLQSFRKRVDDIQADDIRERTSLREEILHLKELNQQINKEAINLTRALKGDKKMQGNWGELILERVLENSGLRKDEEYSVQSGFRDRNNHLQKPDVIVHLPGGKDIIIDSKVSLSAWEKYINCDKENEKSLYLKEHVQNLRNHIANLNSKNYSDIPELQCLDFVLLFIPIDSSFIAAYETDEMLFAYAYDKKIIIVTPTTLLATLKTVENIWRYEHQNRNSREIAERAGSIYDKLCGFLEEMEKIGKQLATCTTTYDTAMNKLSRGRGNIIAQAGMLTELGVQVKKKIPRSLATMADDDKAN